MSRASDAIRAIERARSIGLPTAGSRAAAEILADYESALCHAGSDLCQDGDWERHQYALRDYRAVKQLRAEVARAKQEGLL